MPAFNDGVPSSSLLSVRILSPMFTLLLLTVVCVPLTVRLSPIITFATEPPARYVATCASE